MIKPVVFAAALLIPALAPLASHAAEGDRASRAAEQFKRADTDGNGSLSRAEAEKGSPRLAKNFDTIDANKDGQVSPAEIDAWRKARAAQMNTQRDERVAAARANFNEHFKKADTDGDGALSKAEAENGMPRLAGKFDRIDSDRNGKISQEEVNAWLKARRDARQARPTGKVEPR
jgi:Ca2+-binding EF-hand superfamily protein